MKRILIMAGGTGGHVIPALAVARLLKEQGVEVLWLGTQRGIESRLVPEANIPIQYINIKGLRGKGLLSLLALPFKLTRAIFQACKVIRRFRPDLVLGMGGFASGPGGIAAYLLRCPLVVHEQNAVPGMTNRYLAKIAKQVLEAFPNTFPARVNAICTGNPVPANILHLASPAQRFADRVGPLRLLIMGGSQGAMVLNRLMLEAMAHLPLEQRPEIWHITGQRQLEEVKQAYKEQGIPARVDAFVSNMSAAYEFADLVLCRAGALTISELAAAGVASILVPYPYAVDDHQTVNGNYLVSKEAALLIQERELNVAGLSQLLSELANDPSRLIRMAEAARSLAKAQATQDVVNYCTQIAAKKKIKINTTKVA